VLEIIISICLACAGAQAKIKAGRQELRKAGRKKSQEVYISRMRVAISSGRIPTKLDKCVRLTDITKRAKFHRYNWRDF